MVCKLLIIAFMLIFSLATNDLVASADNISGEGALALSTLSLPASGQSQLPCRSRAQARSARNRAIALVRKGCDLDREGKHLQALFKFETATLVDRGYEIALSNLVTACLVNGFLSEGLDAGQRFIARFPTSPQVQEVTSMINSMKTELKRRLDAEKATGTDVGPMTADYFAYQIVRKVRRWPAYLMPIKVYVASGEGVKQFRPEFKKDLLDSFQEWSDGCHGLISFSIVNHPEEASIDCEWIDDFHKFPTHSGIEGGETVPYYNSSGLVRAKIFLLTTSPWQNRKELRTAMRHVCLHEIGHSLGLIEHSDSPHDIMFYAFQGDDRTRPKLSSRDLMTLVRLYSCDIAQVNGLPGRGQSALSSRVPLASSSRALQPALDKRPEANLPEQISADRH